MKETQEILMVNLDHDYDMDNERFAGAYKNLEKICADMEKELGVDIDLRMSHKVIKGDYSHRRMTQVFMKIDTMAMCVIKMATGADILYSEGIVERMGKWSFIWSERPKKYRVQSKENA